jgi:hypothetical protein
MPVEGHLHPNVHPPFPDLDEIYFGLQLFKSERG